MIRASIRDPVAEWDTYWLLGRGVYESIFGEPGYTGKEMNKEQADEGHTTVKQIYHEYIIQIYTQTCTHMCLFVCMYISLFYGLYLKQKYLKILRS